MSSDDHSPDLDDESFLAWEMRVMDEHRRLRGLIIALSDETNQALHNAQRCSAGYDKVVRRQRRRIRRPQSA